MSLEDYFKDQFKVDIKKLKLFKGESIFPVFPELTRDLQFFELSSIANIEEKNREHFVFLGFTLMSLDQLFYSYFRQSYDKLKSVIVFPKFGHFGMGGAAHVKSPRDFICESYKMNFIMEKVTDKHITEYASFFIKLSKDAASKLDININHLMLAFFKDKDLKPIDDIKRNEFLIYERLYDCIYDQFISNV
ncbi:MAG: hypothetical protein RBS89_07300 [Candidatus Delongbacteria bacterium]|jgi:hypothetical protein|nr:hypothetical protein [Candidatus Delongbacteria bacterium]